MRLNLCKSQLFGDPISHPIPVYQCPNKWTSTHNMGSALSNSAPQRGLGMKLACEGELARQACYLLCWDSAEPQDGLWTPAYHGISTARDGITPSAPYNLPLTYSRVKLEAWSLDRTPNPAAEPLQRVPHHLDATLSQLRLHPPVGGTGFPAKAGYTNPPAKTGYILLWGECEGAIPEQGMQQSYVAHV